MTSCTPIKHPSPHTKNSLDQYSADCHTVHKNSVLFKNQSKNQYEHSKHGERGFTLIEVMVALAILAVVAVAASRASSAYLSSVDTLRTRTLAHFVAQNAAADLRINDIWLTDTRTQTISAQGREWQIIMTPRDGLTPAIKQVNISVAPMIDGQSRAAVTDITVMIQNDQQAIGSLDLSQLGAPEGSL